MDDQGRPVILAARGAPALGGPHARPAWGGRHREAGRDGARDHSEVPAVDLGHRSATREDARVICGGAQPCRSSAPARWSWSSCATPRAKRLNAHSHVPGMAHEPGAAVPAGNGLGWDNAAFVAHRRRLIGGHSGSPSPERSTGSPRCQIRGDELFMSLLRRRFAPAWLAAFARHCRLRSS
jgi:hypothetical protein